jgi:ABC-type oligopeptide transport system ATPase subunit
VGESGCGKTTTSKRLLAAEEPTAGVIAFEGRDLVNFSAKELMDYRWKVRVAFQDPYSPLSPRMRVGDIVGEPIVTHERLSRQEVRARVAELLELVGLRPDMARLFPHEFSGGQRQRLAIARALSTDARLVILDEPVSALDVSIRAHIIGLLGEIQARMGVSYMFIAHDLAAVAHISHQIAVMYPGQIVQIADSLERCDKPLHPYTKALFAASLPSHPDGSMKRSCSAARRPARSIRLPVVAHTPVAPSPCHTAQRRSRSSSRHPKGTESLATSTLPLQRWTTQLSMGTC